MAKLARKITMTIISATHQAARSHSCELRSRNKTVAESARTASHPTPANFAMAERWAGEPFMSDQVYGDPQN